MQFINDPNGSDAMRASRFAVSCAATGRITDPEGFFDTRREIDPGVRPVPIFISAAAVKEMARALDWASPDEIEELTDQIEVNNERIKELEGLNERVTSLKRDLESFAADIQSLDQEKEKAAA